MSQNKNTLRIAVDIGGTFTDMACFDEASGKIKFGKALSTHGHLHEGIQNTLDSAGIDQHFARAQWRQNGFVDHRGLSRHL
jgi:uncharacterized HAD superfamily protein